MLSCALVDPERFPSELLSGIETGVEGELITRARSRGVRVHLEPALVRAVHPWKDLVALLRLWRFFRRGRWEIVHTHSSKAGILGRLAARLAGVPIIIHTAHGWGFTPEQRPPVFRFFVWAERICARISDVIIVVAEEDKKDGLALGIGSVDQYRLIRSGIEVEAYRDVPVTREQARAALDLPADAFVVGSVGRLATQKAPLDLVDGFALLARARPDARLVLVGDGPLRRQVEEHVAAGGLSGRVHLLGLRSDVPRILRAFDVFALTSRWEGLPRVFPQAMAARLPIVATRVDGAADAIIDGENGILVEVGDVAAVGNALLALAEDPARRSRMGVAGFARVDEFSATRMVRELEVLYEELLQRRAH